MQYTAAVCHYGEIALKGKNRAQFEKKLQENIDRKLHIHGIPIDSITRLNGRLLITFKTPQTSESIECLTQVPGLVFIALVQIVPTNISRITDAVIDMLNNETFTTFKIATQRADKFLPFTSQQVNEVVGQGVVEMFHKSVDLMNPDITCYVEITTSQTFIYTNKIYGIGGLPVGTSGRALSLVSAGIDSPVASHLMQRRGMTLSYIHFHTYPYTDRAALDQVRELVDTLNAFQFTSNLHLIPFADIQKKIVADAPESLRVILYRRAMMRIADYVAAKEKIQALITGESVGQVASQTVENIAAIADASHTTILRPLSGYDKEGIITIAKRIGTYEISTRLCEDTCARFMPRNPETKADLTTVCAVEQKLDLEKAITDAITEQTKELREGYPVRREPRL